MASSLGKKRRNNSISSNSSEQDPQTNPYTNKKFSKKYYEILSKRKELPAWECKEKLFSLVNSNPVVILKGETGSGKTTQIPQFLLEKYGKIAVTQPRRVAAMSVAKRVSEEMDVKLGEHVGYSIRFEDCTSNITILKYMTDGMLLKESMSDPLLSSYECIILDECHERTMATDILFGLMKEILQKRKNFKLIVMSATIDIEKFQSFFNAPILEVSGRLFNVEIKYLPNPTDDYLQETVDVAVRIHETEKEGDILIFLTGEEEIENAVEMLYEAIDQEEYGYVNVVPLYSTLPPYSQQKIFDSPPGKNKKGKPGRKIVVSTNIAETSVTIDGIVYVIDSGFSKQKIYNPRLRMESLLITPISKASAKQRAGRAGRTREGICYRLFTKEAYDELDASTYPEILRSNLSSVILTLLKIGITDIVHFDFMDPPAPETMMRSLETLNYMKALDDDGALTEEGLLIANIPLDPELAKVLISSSKFKCVNEILTIVSLLSVPNIFVRPRTQQKSSDEAKKKFSSLSGDHITLLTAFNAYKSNNSSESFCRVNFLSYKNLKNADNIRNQLQSQLESNGVQVKIKENIFKTEFSERRIEKIFLSLLSGCFSQVAHLETQGYYKIIKESKSVVFIHPSSVLSFKPTWVLYNDFVCTGKNYIRTVSKIKPEWLFQASSEYYNISTFEKGELKSDLLKILQKMEENVNEKKIGYDIFAEEDDEREKKKKKEEEIRKINEEFLLSQYGQYSKYSHFKSK